MRGMGATRHTDHAGRYGRRRQAQRDAALDRGSPSQSAVAASLCQRTPNASTRDVFTMVRVRSCALRGWLPGAWLDDAGFAGHARPMKSLLASGLLALW